MFPLSTSLDVATAPKQCHSARFEIAVRSLRSPTGQGRHENQDNYLWINGRGCARFLYDEQEVQQTVNYWPHGHQRLAVLDGMGGHSHGRQAAERAVTELLTVPATTDLNILSHKIDELHCQLHGEFRRAGLETGCTLILLEIPPRAPALLFHVGDSRLYAIYRQQVRCLTIDHVPATHLALLGLLNSSQWTQHVHVHSGSQISQAFILGSTLCSPSFCIEGIAKELYVLHDGNVPPFLQGLGDRRILPLDPEQLYLLASDGLWHLRHPQTFIRRWPSLLIHPERPLETLLEELLAELATTLREQQYQPDDNCTVILLRHRIVADSAAPLSSF